MSHGKPSSKYSSKQCVCISILVALVVVSLLGTAFFVVKVYFLPELQKHHKTSAPLGKVDGSGGSGSSNLASAEIDSDDHDSELVMALVIAIAAVLSSLPIPTLYTVCCIGAGFALGFVKAALVVVPSVSFGIILMFAASRMWLHDFTSNFIRRKNPRLHNMVHAASTRWPIVLLRLTPIPFAIQTMLWGSCSKVPFNVFFPWSMLVVAPQVVLFNYIGASTNNLTQTLNTRSPAEIGILVVGLVVLGLGYVLLTRWAKGQVERAECQAEMANATGPNIL
jgi:uncharacterized membrane protein YdjX (TVP38/TMEM64 family)